MPSTRSLDGRGGMTKYKRRIYKKEGSLYLVEIQRALGFNAGFIFTIHSPTDETRVKVGYWYG